MAEGMASATAAAVLNAIFNNTSYAVTAVWVQLHTAAPGAAGTSNVATETDRQQLSCAAASGGSIASDAALTWVSISGSQDATHYSLWTASTAGTFLGSGVITAAAYTAGQDYTIASGDFVHTLLVAS